MGKEHHPGRSDRSHRHSSSRDKHPKEVPTARPYAPPAKAQPVVAQLAQPTWPPPYKKKKRRSFKLGKLLKNFAMVALALGCMAGGWFGIQALVPHKDRPSNSGPEVAALDTAKNQTPTTAPNGTQPPPPPKVDGKVEEKQPETKMETKPEDPKTEAKTPDPKTEAKTPDPKTETKPPDPKPEPKTETKPADGTAVVFFDKDIKKIMEARCNRCHGDGTAKPKGKFDSRTTAAIIKGGSSGPGVVPGDLKKSLFWTEIEDGNMPPKGEPQLTPEEKKLIQDWVKSGAKESAATAGGAPAPNPNATVLAFEKDIMPILKAQCFSCHDDKQMKGGLDLTTLAKLKKGGESGNPGVVPGEVGKSYIWDLVSTDQMPPPNSKFKLSEAEKTTLMRWIQMGAKDNREAMIAIRDPLRNPLDALLVAFARRP